MSRRRNTTTPTVITSFASSAVLKGLREWGVPVKVVGNDVIVTAGPVTIREMRAYVTEQAEVARDAWTAAGQTQSDTTDRYGNDVRGWDR